MYQVLEDALLQGRKLNITLEYVDQYGSDPVIDVRIEENGKEIFNDLGLPSLDAALKSANQGVKRANNACSG